MGKFIAIDGVDASGKQTHTELLEKYFTEKGVKVRRLSFPMYNSGSSALVKMYLGGQFGSKPTDVNAYARQVKLMMWLKRTSSLTGYLILSMDFIKSLSLM